MMVMMHKLGEVRRTEDLEEEALAQQAQESSGDPSGICSDPPPIRTWTFSPVEFLMLSFV